MTPEEYMKTLQTAADTIEAACGRAEIGVVLGSGLGDYVESLENAKSIAYKEYFPKKEATCTEAGYESYWMCGSDADSNKCRKIFSDEDCTKELAAPIAIPAKGHYFPASAYHAELPGTCTDIGHVEYWHCGQCYKYFTDNTGTTGISNIMLPKDKDNHAQAP